MDPTCQLNAIAGFFFFQKRTRIRFKKKNAYKYQGPYKQRDHKKSNTQSFQV